MAGGYSPDLRKRVIASIENRRELPRSSFSLRGERVDGGISRRRWLDTGTVAAKPMGGAANTRIKDEDAAQLLALVAVQDDLTLQAMQARLRGGGSAWRSARSGVSFEPGSANIAASQAQGLGLGWTVESVN
jgi:hypothetical protein